MIRLGGNSTGAMVGSIVKGLDSNNRPFGIVSVHEFGAKGDGVTDDTQAIRNAINSLVYGGVVVFPPGNYLVSQIDANNYIFLISKPIKLIGAGFVSAIRMKSGTPNTVDLFYFSPNMSFGGDWYGVEKLLIYPFTNTDGRYPFHFDVSQAGVTMSKFYMGDVYVQQHGSSAIRVTNAEGKPDGFFACTFERCALYGGIDLQRSGDSIVFRDCTITGTGRGVRVKSVAIPGVSNYASQLVLDNCNITSDGGAVLVETAKNISILGGNIEQTKALIGNVIDISGTDHTVVNFTMERTHLGVFGTSGNQCNGIRLGDADKVYIEKCTFANEVGGTNIIIDATAKNVILGNNRFESGTQVQDSAAGTSGILKLPTLANSWTEFNSAYYSRVGYYKDRNGWVSIKGLIKDGVITAGTIIFTLPAGYRPNLITPFFTASDNVGTLILAEVVVKDTGEVVVQKSSGSTRLSLDGIRFLAEK